MRAAEASGSLPRWDLRPIFPGVDSPELDRELEQVTRDIGVLADLFDAREIGGEGAPSDLRRAAEVFDKVIDRLNDVLERAWTIRAYLMSVVSADSRDDVAQARLSELRRQQVELSKLETRFAAWLGLLDADSLVDRSAEAREHEYSVRRAQEMAQHLMSRPEEELAAELDPSGGTAWRKLHRDAASQIVVALEVDGEARELSMSELRNLAFHADRDVRRAAYEAELRAWETWAVPFAAAINSIKGQVNTITSRRGWASALDEALFTNAIDRQTLDAMLSAVRETLPTLRRYFDVKARRLGLPILAWYDLFAPVGGRESGVDRTWQFEVAREFIVQQFGTYSERLRDFGIRAFDERWIDAEPRPGKSGGAFCVLIRRDESRILANYTLTYSGVSTLAHELGHGYHNVTQADLTPLQRRMPMTLAETASTFCETIVQEAALLDASASEQLLILEASLERSTQVTVDILSRFLFESRVFEGRRRRELSVGELCDLMLEAQRETYSDRLDGEALHPYMWAVKPHYYGEQSFYNFPYTFGLLFGLGLFARYQVDPDVFRAGYDELLASTGRADAATLAAGFDIDLRSPAFWRASLDVIVKDLQRFEALVDAQAA